MNPAGWDRLLAPLVRARRFDETLVERAGLVTGVFHVSIGMESTAAALACVRSAADVIMLSHRNHGHLAAIGSDPEQLYRELLGRDGGPQRGRAGSLHLADPANGVPYTSAMLGGGVALSAGVALAERRCGGSGIVFAFFGDGAMGEGIVYETLNLAAAWSLPIVFVCENNAPAGREGTAARLANGHDVPAVVVDARRPRATLEALSHSAAAARAGEGPQFLEAGSEPWPGNSTFLPHSAGELEFDRLERPEPSGERFAAGDPVRDEAVALLGEGVSLEAIRELDAAIRERIRIAFEAAAGAPVAPASVATEDVWGRVGQA
jgi:TPP-dependent pyruvate/acetoin dehydrogenase alpha subunit